MSDSYGNQEAGKVSHTPGPWVVSPFSATVLCDTFGRDGDFLPIAQMLWPTDERSEAETYANARLIAAAPELLEALEEAFGELPYPLDDRDNSFSAVAWRKAQAAIAKARGEQS